MITIPTFLEQGLTPDVMDETNPNDVFLGYFKYNSDTAPNFCLMKRVTKEVVDGVLITTTKYPSGRAEWSADWDQRLTITDWRYKDFPA